MGTSSLLRRIAAELHNARYISLDDTSDLRTSRINPAGFVEHDGTLLIDEVQPGGDAFIDRAFGGVDALAADTPR